MVYTIFLIVGFLCCTDVVIASEQDCLIPKFSSIEAIIGTVMAILVSLRGLAEALGQLARFFDNKQLTRSSKILVGVVDSLAAIIGFFGVGKPKHAKDIKTGIESTTKPVKIEVAKALEKLKGKK